MVEPTEPAPMMAILDDVRLGILREYSASTQAV